MHMNRFLLCMSAVLIMSACGTSTNGTSDQAETTSPGGSINEPVETRKPNTNYKPAFNGQTRIAGMKTSTNYNTSILSNDLSSPWGIASLPDGRLLITQKGGNMRIASMDGKLSAPITGLPAVDSRGQGGLLGLAIDPDFATNRTVFWVFSEKFEGGNLTAVAKGQLSSDEKKIENARVIYRALPAYNGDKHYGGRILIARDGNLFVSTGERSDLETRPQAQQLNSALGKIVRITKDGAPVSGNPFATNSTARPEIYTYGHRNVQGIALHPETGDLWETEMGPRGGDELNRITAGRNYGWPTITYGIEYSGATIGQGITQKEGMEQPVYYWDPVLSPSGMTFYSGRLVPEWKNDLFICGLNSNHIARLKIENNRVTGEERILANEGQRFRDITEGKDGALYAVTDGGRLYRIGN